MYIEAVLRKYKMIHVPVNKPLREALSGKSLKELSTILASYKTLHNQTDTDTVKRAIRGIEIEKYYSDHPEIEVELPEVKPLIVGVDIDRDFRRQKITNRLEKRLEEGLVDEVRNLLDQGVSADDLIYYGLEYKFLTLHVLGQLSFDEMFNQLNIAIHQFAKRQMTWFRGMEKRGLKIHWVNVCDPMDERVEKVLQMLE